MTSPLPPDWRTVRAAALAGDAYTCRWCIRPARYVHRVDPAGPYQPDNLISLCDVCRPIHQRDAARGDDRPRRQLSRPADRTRPPGGVSPPAHA